MASRESAGGRGKFSTRFPVGDGLFEFPARSAGLSDQTPKSSWGASCGPFRSTGGCLLKFACSLPQAAQAVLLQRTGNMSIGRRGPLPKVSSTPQLSGQRVLSFSTGRMQVIAQQPAAAVQQRQQQHSGAAAAGRTAAAQRRRRRRCHQRRRERPPPQHPPAPALRAVPLHPMMLVGWEGLPHIVKKCCNQELKQRRKGGGGAGAGQRQRAGGKASRSPGCTFAEWVGVSTVRSRKRPGVFGGFIPWRGEMNWASDRWPQQARRGPAARLPGSTDHSVLG